MRLRSAANNQATRRNEIIKSYLQLGSSSNRYAPRLPQQETKSSTKQLAPMDPILGPENLLKTGFAQKGLPSCPSGRHKPQSFIETKRCASATLIQKTSKNEPKHGPKNGTAWRSHFLGPHAQLSKRTKEKHFHGPIFGTIWRYQKRDRKINSKGRPVQQTKNDMRLVKQQAYRVGTEEARTCEAWFQLTFRPQKWNLKAHMWFQLSPFPSSNAAIAMQHHPCNIHQSVATPRYSATPWYVSIQLPNVIDTISKRWRNKKAFNNSPSHIFP